MFSFLRSMIEDGGMQFGKRLRLPKSRRFIVDYLHVSKQIPSQPLVRVLDVGQIAKLREQSQTRIGWSVLFMKAYAVMAAKHPELWSFVMKWP